MKNLLTILVLLVFCGTCANSATTTKIYNKAGQKIGSYKTIGNKTTIYNKAGQKTGYYKTSSSGKITEYNKYGQKIKTYK